MRSEYIQWRELCLRDRWITWCFIIEEVTQKNVSHKEGVTHKGSTHTIYEGTHTLLSYVDQARDQCSIAKAELWQKEKNVKKKIMQSSSPTTMQTKQKNLQISRSWGRWILKFIEDLNKMQSIEFSCPRRRKQFWQTASTPSLRTCLCSKNSSWKLSIKVKTRIIRKTTYASKGPEVTLRNIEGLEGFDVWCNSWETEIKIADVELWPSYIRESQLVERGITRTRSTCKRITQGQQSEWEGREENSWSRQLRVA